MKTIILILLASCISLFSQDFEPTQQTFIIAGRPGCHLNADSSYFRQNNFILGWAWSCGRKMSECLYDTQGEIGPNSNTFYPDSVVANNINLVVRATGIDDPGGSDGASNCQSLCFSPVLKIINPETQTNIRPSDPRNHIFGFRHINGETIDSNDVSLKLDTNGIYKSSTIPVIDSCWMDNGLYNYNFSPDLRNDFLNRNAEFMYFTINLKRNDSDTSKDNAPVLKIKLPISSPFYVDTIVSTTSIKYDSTSMKYDTIVKLDTIVLTKIYNGFTQFDSIPSSLKNSYFQITTALGENRGIARMLKDTVYGVREIIITRSMLPDTQNITISGRFVCMGDTGFDNPLLSWAGHLGIQVFYLGNLNVKINEISLTTPWARKLYFGAFDANIKNAIQGELNYFTGLNFSSRGIKPFRFNTRDEMNPAYFGMERYLNKFIGNVMTNQSTIAFPRLYFYNTLSPDNWIETVAIWSLAAVPYFKNYNSIVNPNTFGITSGYSNIWGNPVDVLNSGYETYLPNSTHFTYMDTCKMSDYSNIIDGINYFRSFQSWYEYKYILPKITGETMIPFYSDKYWWGESYCGSNWDTTSGRALVSYIRPKTGEEMRLCSFSDLVLGCKGLLYDREQSDAWDYLFGMGYGQNYYNKYHLTRLNTIDFINSDSVGSDFLGTISDYKNFRNFVDLSATATAMGVNSNRIYLGRKSPRTESFKIHRWVHENDAALMKLRLVCWLYKGFKRWYNQDSARFGTDTILKNFIDYRGIKTRPPGRTKCIAIGNPIMDACNDYFEQDTYDGTSKIDSGFYDITILRDSSDHILNGNSWTLGLVNRRTDPLLIFQDVHDSLPEIQFYTTYELDTLAKLGGKTLQGQYHNAAWWKQKYWQRMGTREFVIPFNYKPVDTTEYCLLRIRDIGSGTTLETDTTAWWFQEPYKNRIDTIIGQDKKFVVKLLPGEGRLFQIDVLHPGSASGMLAHSNQTKLITYPTDSTGNYVRYHLTYDKPDGNGINRVYYRRSQRIRKDSLNENIIWESEFPMSSKIIDSLLPVFKTWYSVPCDYPSIVVRPDGNILKAYVVYTCNDSANAYPRGSVVVENVIRYNQDMYINILADQTGKVIARYNGKNRREFGNVVNNASAYGNYYAWSDSNSINTSLIVSAWKPPYSNYFLNSDKDTIKPFTWPYYPASSNSNFLKHPSLNTYSHIAKNEDNCSMVFQGQLNSVISNKNQIFYTRLRHTASGLHRYLPAVFRYSDRQADTLLSMANLSITNAYEDNTFPVIVRNFDNYSFNSSINFPNRLDRVSWQTDIIIPFGANNWENKRIHCRAIDLKDTNNVPKHWTVNKISYIQASKWLEQPSVNNMSDGNFSNYDFNLNFAASPKYQSPTSNSQIWQFPHSRSSLLSSLDTLFTNSIVQVIYQGQLPHLSANSTVLDYSKIWKNRRVYETGNSTPPKILSSAKYFYKRALDDDEMETEAMVGFTNDSSYYYINLPTIYDEYLPLLLPYKFESDDTTSYYERQETDTLTSVWFQVDNEATLNFKCNGYDTSKVSMKIHQQNTNNFIDLSLPYKTTDSTGIIRNYTLVNGQGFNYRLEFTNRDTNAHYSEKLNLEPLTITDTVFLKTTDNGGNIIDLQQQSFIDNNSNTMKLSIYPNPTDKLIYATAYLPVSAYVNSDTKVCSQLVIKIYSNLGTELYKQEVKAGETLQIPTDKLTNGVYFIRAEQKATMDNTLSPAIQSFIIQR